MTDIQVRFLEPVDVLFLRGNRPFGDPGSYGESLLPPWPSVAAGALRSQIFADSGKILERTDDFRVTAFHVAQRQPNGDVQPLYPLPADLKVVLDDHRQPVLRRMRACTPASGVMGSTPLAALPVLAEDARSKPQGGYWLDAGGWQRYLDGEIPDASQLLKSEVLWKLDGRVGIGLDPKTRRAEDGKLFSMQAIVFAENTGFLVTTAGEAKVPDKGLLRLGGDGRGVVNHHVHDSALPHSNHAAIAGAGRARIVLTSPGLFSGGWKLPGMRDDGQWELAGVQGRVIAATVPRAEVVSGWDLAHWQPKTAQRVAPTGSVYWLEDLKASPRALDKLADHGLWDDDEDNESRRVEGYNRFHFAAI